MRPKFFKCSKILLICIIAVSSTAQAQKSQKEIEGNWQGILSVQGAKLRLVFKISTKPDSTLTASFDSPDQGAKNIPVSKVAFKNDNLLLEVKSIQGVFEGKVKKDSLVIEGKWKQGGRSFPLVLRRIDKVKEKQRKEITLSTEILKKYVGKYELQPGFVITITLKDSHLMAQATGQQKFEIFAESETKFFYKVVEAQIEFNLDKEGAVESLTLFQAGREMKAKRVD